MVALPPAIPTSGPEVAALVRSVVEQAGAAKAAHWLCVALALAAPSSLPFRDETEKLGYRWARCEACKGSGKLAAPKKKAPTSRFEALALELDDEDEADRRACCVACCGTGFCCSVATRRKAEDVRSSMADKFAWTLETGGRAPARSWVQRYTQIGQSRIAQAVIDQAVVDQAAGQLFGGTRVGAVGVLDGPGTSPPS